MPSMIVSKTITCFKIGQTFIFHYQERSELYKAIIELAIDPTQPDFGAYDAYMVAEQARLGELLQGRL